MAERAGDQAAGLRRLFGRERMRIVTFAAGSVGVGKSVTVANLAAALARQGKETLIIDENADDQVAALFGSVGRHDLQEVLDRRRKLADTLLTLAPGVRLLRAERAMRSLAGLADAQRDALLESIGGMERPADVILIDASSSYPRGFSPLALAADETVMVLAPTSSAITEAYALIKKLSLGFARRRFRLLVNKVRGADEAEAIHANIAHVTQSRGLARTEFAGHVPLDEHLRQAERLCQPVTALFPDAPAAAAFRQLAGDLLCWPQPDGDDGGFEHFVQQLIHLSQRIDCTAIHAR
ncbi:nucleotide-binding protein [Rhodocyclus tenuis]|uniref:Flagellar biosynthesis protein FlhG n=1 Tax=Rhodocyclus tenuis TaxID=1066 RepID=A0A840GER1_RHOTE|nr:AAA family ATPase [Rhodocyclus tenuis]MBB4246709.1 flagellar biosynthesis protein FlhG [Rhodocyclus tenuis]